MELGTGKTCNNRNRLMLKSDEGRKTGSDLLNTFLLWNSANSGFTLFVPPWGILKVSQTSGLKWVCPDNMSRNEKFANCYLWSVAAFQNISSWLWRSELAAFNIIYKCTMSTHYALNTTHITLRTKHYAFPSSSEGQFPLQQGQGNQCQTPGVKFEE